MIMNYFANSSFIASGKVTAVKSGLIEAIIPIGGLNDGCTITTRAGRVIKSEIVSFQNSTVLLCPYEDCASITVGDVVTTTASPMMVNIPCNPLGMVLNAVGQSIESEDTPSVPFFLSTNAPTVLERKPITKQLTTGIRSIDTAVPLGKGQRIGLFASAGVGKSTLLTTLANNVNADVCVIALIGERGREVSEFIEALGEKGRKKSVVVVSTSDEFPARRVVAAYTAQMIAEEFRNQGKSVLLLMDSLTRFSRAVRDVALSAGELPVRQGYPSQVYQKLPQLLERAGNNNEGSITAIYTVLTNPDGTEDPLADEIKSLLDGHIYLDPKLASTGIRPAIDLEKSVSRLTTRLLTEEQLELSNKLRKNFTRWKNEKEILLFGGVPDNELSGILKKEQQMIDFLTQKPKDKSLIKQTWEQLKNYAQA